MRKIMRARPERCAHSIKVSVTIAGLERTVCEQCGTVSFANLEELTGNVERERFARPADEFEAGRGVLEGLSAGR